MGTKNVYDLLIDQQWQLIQVIAGYELMLRFYMTTNAGYCWLGADAKILYDN
jgi:hypothetical protein